MKPNKVFDETALAGKTVLVTGAARRVGAHIAATAAEAGADVILHYAHSSDEVQKTASAIRKSGHKVETVLYDFSATAEIKDFSERLFQDYHIDILVNNAAIFEPVAMADTSFTTWQKHLDINLTAPFILSQSMAAHFSPEKTGRIINILDWRAFRPGVDHFAYTVSKAALASLTKAMAASLAPRIIVNGIAFGAVLPLPTEHPLKIPAARSLEAIGYSE